MVPSTINENTHTRNRVSSSEFRSEDKVNLTCKPKLTHNRALHENELTVLWIAFSTTPALRIDCEIRDNCEMCYRCFPRRESCNGQGHVSVARGTQQRGPLQEGEPGLAREAIRSPTGSTTNYKIGSRGERGGERGREGGGREDSRKQKLEHRRVTIEHTHLRPKGRTNSPTRGSEEDEGVGKEHARRQPGRCVRVKRSS